MDTIIRNTTPIPTMSLYAKPEHKRAAHVLVCALTHGGYDDWLDASTIWMARLTAPERALLAIFALKSISPDEALLTAETALMRGAGPPIAPLFNYMDEAAFWADMAEPSELDAYCLACFKRMTPSRQSDFLAFVQLQIAA